MKEIGEETITLRTWRPDNDRGVNFLSLPFLLQDAAQTETKTKSNFGSNTDVGRRNFNSFDEAAIYLGRVPTMWPN